MYFSPDRCTEIFKGGEDRVVENKPEPRICRVKGKNSHGNLPTMPTMPAYLDT
jgi:hypothetical protein